MIALALWTCAALPPAPGDALAAATEARAETLAETLAETPSASWWAVPREFEVGQPFRWVLQLRHPAGDLRELEEQVRLFEADLDGSWVLLERERALTLPDPDVSGWERTTTGWRAVSLEPGTRELPPIEIRLAGGDVVRAEALAVEVAGVLGELEDAPRPARGLRSLPPAPEGPSWTWVAPVAAALGAVLLLAALWLRRSSSLELEPRSAESLLRARLGALERDELDAEDVRAGFFEVSSLLRRTLDERAGADRRGLTDEEWLEASRADTGLSAARREDLELFLTRVAAIKYGAAELSPWGVRELSDAVRSVLGPAGASAEEQTEEAREPQEVGS